MDEKGEGKALKRENKGFRRERNEKMGFKTLFYNTQGEKSKLPRASNCLPVGYILCRPALFCADGIVFVPMASRWPPLSAVGVPTALFRPFELCLAFIAQESARKCISDTQPASVLTAGRGSSAWHSNSCNVYSFCILLNS